MRRVIVSLLVLLAASGAAGAAPVTFTDPVGDATPGLDALQNDVPAADIVAARVGPDDPTHLWFSLWLAKLPEAGGLPQEIAYGVSAALGQETVTGIARWNEGEWSYFLSVSGGSRVVSVGALGAVNETDARIDIGVERYHLLDPGTNSTLSQFSAQSRAGTDTYVLYSCQLQACDTAQGDGVFLFGNKTSTGLTFTFFPAPVFAGQTATWTAAAAFTGPDTTFARQDPMQIDLFVDGPQPWRGRIEPPHLALQAGDQANITVQVDAPADATSVPRFFVRAVDGARENTVRLPVLPSTGALRSIDDPLSPQTTEDTPLPFAAGIGAFLVAVWVRRRARTDAAR